MKNFSIILFVVICLSLSLSFFVFGKIKNPHSVFLSLNVKENIIEYLNKNIISKKTFNGLWTLKVDEIQFLCPENNGGIIKIIIGESFYELSNSGEDFPSISRDEFLSKFSSDEITKSIDELKKTATIICEYKQTE